MSRRKVLLLAIAYYLVRIPITFLVLTLVYHLVEGISDLWVFMFILPAVAVILWIIVVWLAKPQNWQDRLSLAIYLILVSVALDFFVSVIDPSVCRGCFLEDWKSLITYLILFGVTLVVPLPHPKKPVSSK